MTPLELFERLGPLVAPALYEVFGKLDLCILATRIVIDVGRYFDIPVEPLPVRAIFSNPAFESHVQDGDWVSVNTDHWAGIDGSHSVGLGFPLRKERLKGFDATAAFRGVPGVDNRIDGWAGHLVARAEGTFGDFTAKQGERRDKGIIVGTAIVGPLRDGIYWSAVNNCGTMARYWRIQDESYRKAPNWRDENYRRKIVGALIRAVRE